MVYACLGRKITSWIIRKSRRKNCVRQLLKDVIMKYFYPDVSVEMMKEKFVINN